MNGSDYQMQYSTSTDYPMEPAQAPSPMFGFSILLFVIIMLVAMWKVFTKAKKPGWAVIIPIYNLYVLMKIVGRPGWWVILYFIPLVNIVISLIVSIDLARSFKRSEAFGVVLLWLVSFVGYLMLGFGKSTYAGPAAGKK